MTGNKARGQSAVLVALMLPFIVGFTLLVVEVAARWLEVASIEDALQQATRSTVQLLDYSRLARGEGGLRASGECRQVTWNQDRRCSALLTVARRLLIANLAAVHGLAESPEALADRVRWTVLPAGGTCQPATPAVPAVSEPTALICAEARPALRGLVGWGTYYPLVIAADTLDPIR